MSIEVGENLLEQAREGRVDRGDFLDAVSLSKPLGWARVMELVERKKDGETGLVEHNPDPNPKDLVQEQERMELTSMMASDAIRRTIEETFGLRLAFQNCHRLAVFGEGEEEALKYFTSLEAQVLNQRKEAVHC